MGDRDALEFLNELIARDDARDDLEADSWVALSFDPETGGVFPYGPFSDPVDAMAWAAEHDADLNSGNGPDDMPFVTKVFPMIEVSSDDG